MICKTAVASTTVPWYCHFVLSQIFPTESPVLQSALDHFLFNLLPPCQVTLETNFVAFEFGWGREIEFHLPPKHTVVTFRFLCDWLIDWNHVTAMTWFHTFSHPFWSLSPSEYLVHIGHARSGHLWALVASALLAKSTCKAICCAMSTMSTYHKPRGYGM